MCQAAETNTISSKKKKPLAITRLTSLANRAAPTPILGQALGQYGINIMESCKNLNNKTSNTKDHTYIPTRTTIPSHNPSDIPIKTPSNTYLPKNIAQVPKGSPMTKKHNPKNSPTSSQETHEIAVSKKPNRITNYSSLEAIRKTLTGSAKSTGLDILQARPSAHL